MSILNINALDELSQMFFEAEVRDISSSESHLFNGISVESFTFFLPEAGYGASIRTKDGGFEVRLLDVTPDKWDGVAGWDLVHLSVNAQGHGTRICRMQSDGTFTVEAGMTGSGLIQLMRNQYPEELSSLSKLNRGGKDV